MSLLDTVEPAGWKRTRISNGEVEYFTERDWKHESLFEWEPQYSRETVESLFSQCRKEALLEAAVLADAWGEARNPDNGGHALRNYANELRRMAESVKTTMEGEN